MKIVSNIIGLNGTRLYYEAAGSGPAVVLLHGFSLDTRMWDDQFELLAEHFRVIRYDMRGFGKSDLPTAEPYSHVDDLAALLDHLGILRAHVVGFSRGGAVALDFALTLPNRLLSLALIDTVLGGFDWSAQARERDGLVWQLAKEGGIAAAKESWLTHPLFAPAQRQLAAAARLTQMVNDYSGWHFVNSANERYPQPAAATRLHELKMPILVMVGELDLPDFQQVADLICQHIPQARKLIVPGVGHMSNMEAPAQVNAALLEFLTRL
jgi:pimeloyl-ACP methyl ester carboxylesterase